MNFSQSVLSGLITGRLSDIGGENELSIRIFLSSTFTDTQYERNELIVKVFPELSRFCSDNFNLELRIIDMRWGLRDEMTNDQLTTDICLREIINCRKESCGFSFVTMLDQKRGYCPPPRIIDPQDMEKILKEIARTENNLLKFYVLD